NTGSPIPIIDGLDLRADSTEIPFDPKPALLRLLRFLPHGESPDFLASTGRDQCDSQASPRPMLCPRPSNWRSFVGDPWPLPQARKGKSFSRLRKRKVPIGNPGAY